MKLDDIGGMLVSGFGDKILTGIIVGLLDNVTPERCYQYIKDDMQLGYWMSDSGWRKFRQMAKGANIDNITSDNIIEELRESNPDLLGVIINHPDGRNWFDKQIDEVKRKLGLE